MKLWISWQALEVMAGAACEKALRGLDVVARARVGPLVSWQGQYFGHVTAFFGGRRTTWDT